MKLCSLCQVEKPLSDYTRAGKGKYRSCCKVCYKERYGEKEKQNAQKNYQKNKEKRDKANIEWRKNNKEQSRRIYQTYYKKNKKKILEKQKEIRKSNPQYYADYARNREKKDLNFKIVRRLRNRVYSLMRGNNSQVTLKLLGCSIDVFKTHLETQFESWMNWSNYGQYDKNKRTWQIDHIKPCTLFDLTKKEEQEKCFHYTNLQPLESQENLSKGGRYEST